MFAYETPALTPVSLSPCDALLRSVGVQDALNEKNDNVLFVSDLTKGLFQSPF